MVRRIASVVAVCLILLACLLWFYSHSAASPEQDMTRLQRLAESQSYEATIKRLQDAPPSSGGFRFVVLGDTRDNLEVAKKLIEAAGQEKPAFILHTGDLVHDGTPEEYFSSFLPLVEIARPVPILAVPGNHENGPNLDLAGFKALYGSDHFSFDYGGCRFVGINNVGAGSMGVSALGYLEQELSKPSVRYRFVIAHMPPQFLETATNEGPTSGKRHGFQENQEALRMLLQSQKVTEAFFGHDHGFLSRSIDGLQYTIAGGGGAPLYKNMEWLDPTYHYLVISVSPEGIRREVVKLRGKTWERSEVK